MRTAPVSAEIRKGECSGPSEAAEVPGHHRRDGAAPVLRELDLGVPDRGSPRGPPDAVIDELALGPVLTAVRPIDQQQAQVGRPILLASRSGVRLAGAGAWTSVHPVGGPPSRLLIRYDSVNVNVHRVSEKQLRSSEPLAPT
jgi:hypothetical protein